MAGIQYQHFALRGRWSHRGHVDQSRWREPGRHHASRGGPVDSGAHAGRERDEIMQSAMTRTRKITRAFVLCALMAAIIPATLPPAHGQSYKYFRLGNAADAQTKPVPGYALMGGGSDLDVAFKWLCDRASGGDFLVLRAHGDDDYNPYINGLCKVNSVSTLILPDRTAAQDPRVA